MKSLVRVVFVLSVVLIVVGCVLFYPYATIGIPEWKLQILDESGKPLAHVTVHQEWLVPIDEGVISADSREADANGIVTFPERIRRNRLVFGLADSVPSARAFVCWQNQYGAAEWQRFSSVSPSVLKLKSGACPFG